MRLRPPPRAAAHRGRLTSPRCVDAGRRGARGHRGGHHPVGAGAGRPALPARRSTRGSTWACPPTPTPCCSARVDDARRGRRGERRRGSSRCFEAAGADVGGPVDRRRRGRARSSPRAGWPTRRSSGSGRCSPRTSACPRARVPEMLGRDRGDRRAARRRDRQHRARRRRQPAPADHRRARRRRRPGAGRRPPSRRSSTPRIALGGTVTGEHGVGLLKRGGLERETGAGGAGDAPRRQGARSTPRASSTPARCSTRWVRAPSSPAAEPVGRSLPAAAVPPARC